MKIIRTLYVFWHTKFCILPVCVWHLEIHLCLRCINANKSVFYWHHCYILYFEIGHRSGHLTHLIERDVIEWGQMRISRARQLPRSSDSSYLSLFVILVSSSLFLTLCACFKNWSLLISHEISKHADVTLLMTVWKKSKYI